MLISLAMSLAAAGTAALPVVPAHPDCAENLQRHLPDARSRPIEDTDLIELLDIGSNGSLQPDPVFALSPDQSRIAVAVRRANIASNSYCSGIYIVDRNGKNVLADHGPGAAFWKFDSFYDTHGFPTGVTQVIAPQWSPDGRLLAFPKFVGDRLQLWAWDAAGGSRAIVTDDSDIIDFRFNAEGTSILYKASDDAGPKSALRQESLRGYRFDERFFPFAATTPFPRGSRPYGVKVVRLQDGGIRQATTQEAQAFVQNANAEAGSHYPGLKTEADGVTRLYRTARNGTRSCSSIRCTQVEGLPWIARSGYSPATASRVMANRAVVSSGLATMSTANEWFPTIRAVVFGIMLFMVPVALLFILTSINLRVASFALGLFVFVALWGVIDAGIYQLTLGRATATLAEMRANHLAANAWMLAPSAAMKALAIFGSFRTAGAGLAGAFVFTVFRFSGNVFSSFTGGSLGVTAQASSAAATVSTSEGYASALEAQASAAGTGNRRAAASSFGDFGERSSFGATRSFGAAGAVKGAHGGVPGQAALGMGGIDAGRELGGLAPALAGRDLSDPAVKGAVQAAAATGAIHNFAEKDALRKLGTDHFGAGQGGEKAFAAFTQNLVQWRAFGDTRAYDMMMQSASRHFERAGYAPQDAALKASGVIAQAQADPTFAKLIANSFSQGEMLKNELTAAQTQVGAMEGRRDYAGSEVSAVERGNVATEQARRTGGNEGQRFAARMLGLPVDEMNRRIAFINALSGEARSTAISQLSRATGRSEAQVMHALETYRASSEVGTADGATAEASREGTSVYGRTREAAGYDFAERSGKLDAQRELGHDGTRSAARIGEQRRQSDNFGFAEGAAAAGMSTREAARLDSFIRTLSDGAGNQLDMAEGGADGVADRARNARMTSIVEKERLARLQSLLKTNGIDMSKRQIAMDQNGDFSLNLTPATAAQMWKAGLINESQLGAVANGGHARFSLAHNDLLVSSSASYEKSARNDTSTRFEAGKQAGPDTIEHFLGGGAEGKAAMANWLRGGFEMDRKGNWRLKPQVADTLQRDVQAIMAQTGWERSIGRAAQDQNTFQVSVSGEISGGAGSGTDQTRKGTSGRTAFGRSRGSLGISTQEVGSTSETASSQLNIVNYEVRQAVANAERSSARSPNPAEKFSESLAAEILGPDGLRSRYLGDADSGGGVVDLTAPVTSLEQSSLLNTGRFSTDLKSGPFDGDTHFKKSGD